MSIMWHAKKYAQQRYKHSTYQQKESDQGKSNCNRSKKFTHLDIKFSRLIRVGLFAAFNILLVIAEAASRIKNLQK